MGGRQWAREAAGVAMPVGVERSRCADVGTGGGATRAASRQGHRGGAAAGEVPVPTPGFGGGRRCEGVSGGAEDSARVRAAA
jgi:hypothetical protein